MMKVRPIYKCRICSEPLEGEVMEMSERSLTEMLEDVLDRAAPVVAPHNCDHIKKIYGAFEYVGFKIV
jgi:hypothetical protein